MIAAVVITHNRKALLDRCLAAIVEQSRRPDRIIVVDNASTDGTGQMLRDTGWTARTDLEWLRLPDNTGGAGGFATGLRHAVASNADWTWMMDDDAVPRPDALERLLSRPLNPENLYASTAVFGDRLAWPLQPADTGARFRIGQVQQLPDEIAVHFAPFLGLLVSAQTVRSVGTPDAGFFIAADDVDYCMRARRQGAQVILVRDSRIEHPPADARTVSLLGARITILRLAPWKRYYDVRNRLLVARAHYGAALYYAALPGTLIRLLVTLACQEERLQQLRAFAAGVVDGLLGRKGRRHSDWGIR